MWALTGSSNFENSLHCATVFRSMCKTKVKTSKGFLVKKILKFSIVFLICKILVFKKKNDALHIVATQDKILSNTQLPMYTYNKITFNVPQGQCNRVKIYRSHQNQLLQS